ncbi:hypothetical protein [Micromonospora haikouensis]|uniref:hypothetical protein n=1 Tax=Micromonospora haikouensis TaxID=686309 RepID=UPI003D7289A3
MLSLVVVLTAGGCADSAQEDARKSTTAHIEQVAADAADWARRDGEAGRPPDTRDVLRYIVASAQLSARELDSEVHTPDADGTGLLGEVRLVLEGQGSSWLWSQDQAPYIFCARFQVTRQPDQPRDVSATLFPCPPDAVPSGWTPTGPAAAPTTTPS